MFERFKKETIIIHEFEFVPQFDYEHCTKEELTTFLKSLSRPQLLHLGDTLDFDAIDTKLDLWEIYYSVISWHGVWPLDDDASKALNILFGTKTACITQQRDYWRRSMACRRNSIRLRLLSQMQSSNYAARML